MSLGDIGPIIDTLEFDTNDCLYPTIVHVSGTVYAIGYLSTGGVGYIKTFNAPCADPPGITQIDSWNHSAAGAGGNMPILFHAAGNWFLLVWDNGTNIVVRSFQIAAGGTITKSFTSTINTGGTTGHHFDIVHVSGTTYVLTQEASDGNGYLTSFTMTGGGALTSISVVLINNGTSQIHGRLAELSPNYVVCTYEASNIGLIWVANVTGAGVITRTDIDTFRAQFIPFNGYTPCVKVSGTIIAVAYGGVDGDGFIQTIAINGVGVITNLEVDIYEFDTTYGLIYDLVSLGDNYYAVIYEDSLGNGLLKSFYINPAGAITEPFLDSFEVEPTTINNARIAPFQSDCMVTVYEGFDGDGFLKTVDVELPGEEIPHHEMIMGMGP